MSNSLRFRVILLLGGISVIGPMATHVFVPSLPLVRSYFAASFGMTQWTMTANMAAFAIGVLFFGAISDRIGRRPALLLGLLVYCIGSALCLLSQHIEFLIFGRIILGFGSGAGMVLARVMVVDLYPAEKVAATLAHVTIVMFVVPALSPLAGGLLAEHFGWRSVFWLLMLLSAALLIGVKHSLPESRPASVAAQDAAAKFTGAVNQLLRHRRFIFLALQNSFALATFYYFATAMPYIMVDTWGRGMTEYGLWHLLLAGTFLAGTIITARTSSDWHPDQVVRISVTLMMLVPLALWLIHLAGSTSPALYFGAMSVFAFLSGILNPASQSIAMLAVTTNRGTASSLFSFFQFFVAAAYVQVWGQVALASTGLLVTAISVALTASLVCGFLGLRPTRSVRS